MHGFKEVPLKCKVLGVRLECMVLRGAPLNCMVVGGTPKMHGFGMPLECMVLRGYP